MGLLGEGGGFGGAKKATGEGEDVGHGAAGFEINADGPMVGKGDRHPIPGVGNIKLEGMIGKEGLACGGSGDRGCGMAGVVVEQLAETNAGEIETVAIALLSIPLSPFPFRRDQVGPGAGGLGCGVDQPKMNMTGGQNSHRAKMRSSGCKHPTGLQ